MPYRNQSGPAAGPLSAIVDAFNITDLWSAFVKGPMRLVRDQQRQILRQNSVKIGIEAGHGQVNWQEEGVVGNDSRPLKNGNAV